MGWKVNFAASAESDLIAILRHLLQSYLAFGEDVSTALGRAEKRTLEVRANADRLALAPRRGTNDDHVLPGLRHVTLGDAVFYFDLDETTETITVRAVFFGGQDHQAHMLRRLLGG